MTALVVVTVGTDHHPFHRLVDWIDSWRRSSGSGAECFLQYGTSRPLPGAHCCMSLAHAALEEKLAAATCVVTHAGPGCVMEARHHGHLPIVVPRQRSWGEHVDDHQLAFARAAAAAGVVRVAQDADQLATLIDQALSGDPSFRVNPQPLIEPATIERFGSLVAHLDPARALLSMAHSR